jgi:hypothetical protein
MSDKDFLIWLYNRLQTVYGESELVDFVQRLKAIIESMDDGTKSKW